MVRKILSIQIMYFPSSASNSHGRKAKGHLLEYPLSWSVWWQKKVTHMRLVLWKPNKINVKLKNARWGAFIRGTPIPHRMESRYTGIQIAYGERHMNSITASCLIAGIGISSLTVFFLCWVSLSEFLNCLPWLQLLMCTSVCVCTHASVSVHRAGRTGQLFYAIVTSLALKMNKFI